MTIPLKHFELIIFDKVAMFFDRMFTRNFAVLLPSNKKKHS